MFKTTLLLFFLCISGLVEGLGLTIEPVLAGDKSKYSSIHNLQNCISYPTVKDDIIMVRIKSGDKIQSQRLNLNIFDSENNKIRFKKDISQDMNLIFTNLNNPSNVNSELEHSQLNGRRSNIFDRLSNLAGGHLDDGEENKAGADGLPAPEGKGGESSTEHMDSNKGKSLIYICFDNVYTDRSWSFHPIAKDVELYTEIKTMWSIKETDYNKFSHYFGKFKDTSSKSDEQETAKEAEEFTEDDFKKEVQHLENELNDVIETLKKSESILQELLQQEFLLRDANEAIFSGYTKISIIMLVSIFIAGLIQMTYQTYFLKKRKVI